MTILLYIMALVYVAAGINHFVNPKWYLRIMPPWLPAHNLLNKLSGICEIIFAILLIPMQTRSIGAWLIIALLIAIFPANIQMSINFKTKNLKGFWLTILRLPFQILLIWWAYQYTKS